MKVIVNPYFAPYTLINKSGVFQGISADVLRIIHLRTGISFVPVVATSIDNMFSLADNNKGDMLAAMSYSPVRQEKLNFTRPYISTPFVLIVRNVPGAPVKLEKNMKIATTRDNIVADSLKKEFPDIDFVMADNASLAMKMVEEGKADAALHNQLGADYMIERFFKGKLKISTRIAEEPAQVSFAVRWDEPELYSILNKALSDIEPQDISLLVNKWQSMPDTPISTWSNYSTQFYSLLTIGFSFIIFILIFNNSRNKKMSKKLALQKRIQDQIDFLDKILDASPTPVYFVDKSFKVIKHNRSFFEFFSGKINEHCSLAIFDKRNPLYELSDIIQSAMNSSEKEQNKIIKNKLTLKDENNPKIISHWILPHFDESGLITGLICGWIDITHYETNLEHLDNQLKVAENASKAKSDYLATISHEIRTQISPILGVLELEIINYPENNNLKVAFESSRNLLELLGNVIDIAKIENGKIDLISSWVPLKETILPVVKVFSTMASQKGNTLKYKDKNTESVEAYFDISRFRQVVSNIISNAVKFTENGYIDIEFNAIYINNHTVNLELIIKDSGTGIASSDLKNLFKPFSQVGEGKKKSGSGLGLSISHQILEAMKGKIEIQSVYGMGTSVHIELKVPVRQAIPYTIGEFPSDDFNKNLLILIVDDHPASRMVLRQQLSSLGHKVIESSNPDEALTLLNETTFDVVFTDCNMPNMDGFTFTKLIREFNSKITIIGLTASAFTSTRMLCIDAGMDECIFKPAAIYQLKDALRNVQLLTSTLPLSKIIDMKKLNEMMHDNESAVAHLLQKVDQENTNDLKFAKIYFEKKDWDNLAKCIHRISGGAQIIYCSVIDQICNRIEMLCSSPAYPSDIEKYIIRLETKLNLLHRAISEYLSGISSE